MEIILTAPLMQTAPSSILIGGEFIVHVAVMRTHAIKCLRRDNGATTKNCKKIVIRLHLIHSRFLVALKCAASILIFERQPISTSYNHNRKRNVVIYWLLYYSCSMLVKSKRLRTQRVSADILFMFASFIDSLNLAVVNVFCAIENFPFNLLGVSSSILL